MAVGYAEVILADTPQSYWRLGDLVAGSSAADAKGTVTGTYSGQFQRGMPGAVQGDNDSCVFFRSGYVDMGVVYPMSGTQAFSIEAWVQLQLMPGGVESIIGNYYQNGSGFQGYGMAINQNGFIECWRALNGTFTTAGTANNVMPLGQWTHIVGTYDGTNVKLYVNGTLMQTTASSLAIAATGSNFRIASDNIGNNLPAMVDEAAVYNYALTQTQVQTHYNSASFLANAPTYLAAISGGTQVASSGQINQSLGLHTLTVHNTGLCYVGSQGSSATPGTTWTLSGQWLDQPFTLPSSPTLDTIDRVEIALKKLGTGADITVTLRPDNSGAPSATILQTVKIPADFVPTGRSRMVSIPMQATGLTGGGVYHLVLQSNGTSGNTLVAPQGGSGLGNLQTSPDGSTWTSHTGVSLIAGIWQGDAPPTRNVREASDCWAELENDAGGRLVGVYEMVQGARTAHRLQYSGYGRLTKIV